MQIADTDQLNLFNFWWRALIKRQYFVGVPKHLNIRSVSYRPKYYHKHYFAPAHICNFQDWPTIVRWTMKL
jgi:hypothetical protein